MKSSGSSPTGSDSDSQERALAGEGLEHAQPDALAPHEVADPARDVPGTVSRNVRWNFAGHFWTLAITLIATPVIIRRLGTDAYGIIAALAIVTNYMAFLDLGLSQATIKHVAEFRARQEWNDVRLVFWTSMIGYLVLGILAAAIVIAVTPVAVSRWLRIPSELEQGAIGAFYVGAAGIFLVLLNFGPTSLIKGLERFDLVNKIGMIVGTAQPLFTLAMVLAGASLPLIVAGNVMVLLVSVLLNMFFARGLLGNVGAPAWDTRIFLRLARYGGYLAAASVLAPIVVSAEKLLLAGAVSISALTYYMVPQSLLARLAIIPASFSSALFPAFAALHSRGERDRNVRLNVEVARTLVYVFAPIVLVLLAFGEMLLAVWMGDDFASQSAVPLKILTVAAFVQAWGWTPHVLVQAVGRTDVTFRIYLIQTLVYLPFAYVAVLQWGLPGAAWAWLARVALDAGLVWSYAKRLAGLSVILVLRSTRVVLALAGLGVVSAAQVVPEGYETLRIVGVVSGALLTLIVTGSPLYLIIRQLVSGRVAERWETG